MGRPLASILKDIRVRAFPGMAVPEFAKLLGVGKSSVYDWEKGIAVPKSESLFAYRSLTRKVEVAHRALLTELLAELDGLSQSVAPDPEAPPTASPAPPSLPAPMEWEAPEGQLDTPASSATALPAKRLRVDTPPPPLRLRERIFATTAAWLWRARFAWRALARIPLRSVLSVAALGLALVAYVNSREALRHTATVESCSALLAAGLTQDALRYGLVQIPSFLQDYFARGAHQTRSVPDKPFPHQAHTPCRSGIRITAINGGCWFDEGPVPCNPDLQFEHAGRCYQPIRENPDTPITFGP